ncbi:MAG: hypothetical protein JNK73_13255 [Bacteroidia bacterium]|nr:hypothetical protein [Bacteroidia bacterium]
MFNFFINFAKVIKENLPGDLRTEKRVSFITAAIRPFKIMFNELLVKFNYFIYRCNFNGQVIYLETALNDTFDPIDRGIYIEDIDRPKVYIYRKSELKPAIILYMKWRTGLSFATGKFCWYQGAVYSANSTALNKVPGVDPEWDLEPSRSAPILRKKEDYTGGFFVFVPAALVYSAPQMHALIKYYKLAGPGYTIKTY